MRKAPEKSCAELDSLLGAQREDGFIGHTIFWESAVHWHRLPFYNVLGRWSPHTETIHPPMLAWAWRACRRDPAEEPRLALPDLPTPIGRRLVEEHLIPHFFTPVPIPSVLPGMQGYEEGIERWIRAYWRGPVWANPAWLVWLGLVRLGYRREADQVRDGWVRAVAREGLREFYAPLPGEGHGARKFGWTWLILDMLAGDEAGASRSYLPDAPRS